MSSMARESEERSHRAGKDNLAAMAPIPDSAALPSKDELLVALCGSRVSGPLCHAARDLVQLHRRRREYQDRITDIDGSRAETVARIDRFVTRRTPRPHRDARVYPETMGTLIDRMAAAAERAMHIMMTAGPRSEAMHVAWTKLAELEIQYADLAEEVAGGRRRLPPGAA